jgi:hypothetical protein
MWSVLVPRGDRDATATLLSCGGSSVSESRFAIFTSRMTPTAWSLKAWKSFVLQSGFLDQQHLHMIECSSGMVYNVVVWQMFCLFCLGHDKARWVGTMSRAAGIHIMQARSLFMNFLVWLSSTSIYPSELESVLIIHRWPRKLDIYISWRHRMILGHASFPLFLY